MWNIKVEVTQEHINNACRKNSHHCMVSDAVHDRLRWATFVQTDTQSIRFNNSKQGKRYIYLTPPEAQRAIVLFDQGIKVKPFSFTLNQGFSKVRTMKTRQTDRNKDKRSLEAKRRRKTLGRKKKPSHLSMYREFGLRKLVR